LSVDCNMPIPARKKDIGHRTNTIGFSNHAANISKESERGLADASSAPGNMVEPNASLASHAMSRGNISRCSCTTSGDHHGIDGSGLTFSRSTLRKSTFVSISGSSAPYDKMDWSTPITRRAPPRFVKYLDIEQVGAYEIGESSELKCDNLFGHDEQGHSLARQGTTGGGAAKSVLRVSSRPCRIPSKTYS